MKKTIITALALSMALGASAANARPNGPGLPQFSEIDTDGNGQISTTELAAVATVKFNENDVNGDGFLDAAELESRMQERFENMPEGARGARDGHGPRGNGHDERRMERMGDFAERMIARSDTDEDGKLSLEEVTADRPEIAFERLDADSDGSISEMEWHVVKDHRGEKGHGRGRGRG